MRELRKALTPTSQKNFNNNIYGLDIETYNKNKSFYCGTVYKDNINYWVFTRKRKLIDFLKTKRFENSIIATTNLGFDFNGVFYNEPEFKDFRLIMRGSQLIVAKAHIYNKRFNQVSNKVGSKRSRSISFIDTLNYALLSVDKMGELLNIPKLDKPVSLGRRPNNYFEKDQLIKYNIRDSEISKRALLFLYNSFYELGASCKPTIASTSMSLFRNNYLDDKYFVSDTQTLLEEFKAYYGGRTEAFGRGLIKNYNYYDFNSLYPSVMINEYPNPNSLNITYNNSDKYIFAYEGVSFVELHCPFMEYPLLPLRTKDKLLFPIGSFTGWYSHLELRKSFELGYVLKQVHKTIYFKETCFPFVDFVNDLYNLRLKNKNNPMGFVVKILMNSLYGKFGQKFENVENLLTNPTYDELIKYPFFERIGECFRVKKPLDSPRSFCFPIWALYTTAYARLKLHEFILRCNPVYVDTDSLMTTKELISSNKLGKLKLEMKIKKGIVVKPKFYMLFPMNRKEYIKVKGVGMKLKSDDFMNLLATNKITYNKFMKLKESIRRGFIPNEIQKITKTLSLEDDKRKWFNKFNPDDFEMSKPIDTLKYREIPFMLEYNTNIY